MLRFPIFNGDWEEKSFGDIASIRSASRVHKDEWTEKGVPFFRSSDVVSHYKGTDNKKAYISRELFDELSAKSGKIKRHDLLVTGGGSIGIPYLVPNDAPLYFKDADLLWFKKSVIIDSYFLYTYLSTTIFRRYLTSVTHIGTIAHYTIEQAKATPVILPSLPEQRKIADFLTTVSARIQQLIQKKALLEVYKKGVMQQLFTQAIRFQDDHGNDFPDWEEKKLGEVCSILKGKGISKAEVVESGATPCIRYGELYTEYSELIQEAKSRTDTPTNELVLSAGNDVIIPASGETHIDIATASCVMNEGIALGGDLNIIRTELNGIFLAYYLNNACKHAIARVAQGSSVIHLYPDQLKGLALAFPSQSEQTKIADFLSAIDRKIEKVATQISETQTFKKGLLQQMFV